MIESKTLTKMALIPHVHRIEQLYQLLPDVPSYETGVGPVPRNIDWPTEPDPMQHRCV